MDSSKVTKVSDLIANPDDHFSSPMQVLDRKGLSREDRLLILKAMELDAKELSVATAENMPGRKAGATADRLSAIRDAIREFEERDQG